MHTKRTYLEPDPTVSSISVGRPEACEDSKSWERLESPKSPMLRTTHNDQLWQSATNLRKALQTRHIVLL